jgi:aminoglycoside phosphotransferase (APT) family kinase protein
MKKVIAGIKKFVREMDKERRAAARALPKRERLAAEYCARAMTAWEMAQAENEYGGTKTTEIEAAALLEAAFAVEDFCRVIGVKFTPEGRA